jgi:hypothetical protein
VRHLRFALAATAAALLTACSGDAPPVTGPKCYAGPALTSAPAPVPATSPHDALFVRAGAEFGVPAELLRAIGYVESRWEMVEGAEEFPGLPPAHGIMGLGGERLRRGAALAGVSVEAARSDPEANVRAAAALLRAHADELRIDRADQEAWAPAVVRFSGIATPEAAESYARDGVSRALGGARAAYSRAAMDPCAPKPPATPVDFAGATWRPAPQSNYGERTAAGEGSKIHMVIIHTCEGNYAGCWGWLTNTQSGVSAHYVVREDGGEVSQLVKEAQRAFHIGARYDCTLNGNHDCALQDVQSNHFTIGIEHGGRAAQTTWPEAQIDVSARLVCDITKRWNIPRDRFHVVAHGQLQPYNRTDPGPNWPWADYLARIRRHCGE